jgi:hypothetical protein
MEHEPLGLSVDNISDEDYKFNLQTLATPTFFLFSLQTHLMSQKGMRNIVSSLRELGHMLVFYSRSS